MTAETTRRRVLVLTSTFPRWEGDHEPPFVYELCRRLASRFDVLVLAPHAPGTVPWRYMNDVGEAGNVRLYVQKG